MRRYMPRIGAFPIRGIEYAMIHASDRNKSYLRHSYGHVMHPYRRQPYDHVMPQIGALPICGMAL